MVAAARRRRGLVRRSRRPARCRHVRPAQRGRRRDRVQRGCGIQGFVAGVPPERGPWSVDVRCAGDHDGFPHSVPRPVDAATTRPIGTYRPVAGAHRLLHVRNSANRHGTRPITAAVPGIPRWYPTDRLGYRVPHYPSLDGAMRTGSAARPQARPAGHRSWPSTPPFAFRVPLYSRARAALLAMIIDVGSRLRGLAPTGDTRGAGMAHRVHQVSGVMPASPSDPVWRERPRHTRTATYVHRLRSNR